MNGASKSVASKLFVCGTHHCRVVGSFGCSTHVLMDNEDDERWMVFCMGWMRMILCEIFYVCPSNMNVNISMYHHTLKKSNDITHIMQPVRNCKNMKTKNKQVFSLSYTYFIYSYSVTQFTPFTKMRVNRHASERGETKKKSVFLHDIDYTTI